MVMKVTGVGPKGYAGEQSNYGQNSASFYKRSLLIAERQLAMAKKKKKPDISFHDCYEHAKNK